MKPSFSIIIVVDAWIEDLNSRNGTFTGPSPLDLQRITNGSKVRLIFGDYLRFGHSQKYFRYLENIPNFPDENNDDDELQVLRPIKSIQNISPILSNI